MKEKEDEAPPPPKPPTYMDPGFKLAEPLGLAEVVIVVVVAAIIILIVLSFVIWPVGN